jgi:hypothetical protein
MGGRRRTVEYFQNQRTYLPNEYYKMCFDTIVKSEHPYFWKYVAWSRQLGFGF